MQVHTVLMLYVIYTDVYVLQAHAFWWGLTCGDIISSFIKQLLCKDYKDYKVIYFTDVLDEYVMQVRTV